MSPMKIVFFADVKEAFLDLGVWMGFILGLALREELISFSSGRSTNTKMGFVSSYFRLSIVWFYLQRPTQEAARCCCRRDHMKATTR